MEPVGKVLIDESLLFGQAAAEEDAWNLLPGAAILLLRLQHSNLCVGICYEEGTPISKVNFLLEVAARHSFESVCRTSYFLENSSNDLSEAWRSSTGCSVYVTSRNDLILYHKLWNEGWRIILKGTSSDLVANERLLFIERLEELLITFCRFNKMGAVNQRTIIVGYVMKQSREKDFLKRGAFPMYPTECGLVFVPIIMEVSIPYQMQVVDALLHKATDEIMRIDLSHLDSPNKITFSEVMEEIQRYVKVNPHCCIIDPLNKVFPLLDRFQIQQILCGLDDLDGQSKFRIRAPQFLKVNDFQDPKLKENLLESTLSFPCIVKPQSACGVAHAHSMALVFKVEDFGNLPVPIPAIIQEYVDHGSIIYKFYVLGERVFYAVKRSMPNSEILLQNSVKSAFGPILFDSLKSLPTEKGEIPTEQNFSLDLDLINIAAKWLREYLNLTVFGFDVVIQEGCGDHVIVDLNYLPSFKEVPDSDAIPAFWSAIKRSYGSSKTSQPLVY